LILLHLTDCGGDDPEYERHEDAQDDPPGKHDTPILDGMLTPLGSKDVVVSGLLRLAPSFRIHR